LFEYVFLWLYAACYVAIWVVLPFLEWKEATPVLRWFSAVIHSTAVAAMIAYLVGLPTSGVPFVWWTLLVATASVTVVEDVVAYRRIMKKPPEPRLFQRANMGAALFGSLVEAILRIPCLVIVYRLAARD
jgi:hypothetical protein